MTESKVQRLVELVRRTGMVRPRDLKALGISSNYLWKLHRRGVFERLGRGTYALRGAEVTENHSLAEACKRVPHGVVCLLSALRYHGLTTQAPSEVWLAIGHRSRGPRLDALPLRVARFSGRALTEGVEEHEIEGVRVRVYSPAKTVADCFKYRNRIGRDIAVEALRDCRAQRKCTNDELWRYAKVCRVTHVMRPYLEAIL